MSDNRVRVKSRGVASVDLSHARRIRHYLSFPERDAAEAASADLKVNGFTVEVRPAGAGWLVLAAHITVPEADVLTIWEAGLTSLAAALGGEYGGWEAEVCR